MIIVAIITIVVCAISLECFVKAKLVRCLGVFALLIASSILANSIGMNLGKVDQLNRFARLLPRAFVLVESAEKNTDTQISILRILIEETGNPKKLNDLESTLTRIERIGDY
jgi:hypothetical protein